MDMVRHGRSEESYKQLESLVSREFGVFHPLAFIHTYTRTEIETPKVGMVHLVRFSSTLYLSFLAWGSLCLRSTLSVSNIARNSSVGSRFCWRKLKPSAITTL